MLCVKHVCLLLVVVCMIVSWHDSSCLNVIAAFGGTQQKQDAHIHTPHRYTHMADEMVKAARQESGKQNTQQQQAPSSSAPTQQQQQQERQPQGQQPQDQQQQIQQNQQGNAAPQPRATSSMQAVCRCVNAFACYHAVDSQIRHTAITPNRSGALVGPGSVHMLMLFTQHLA